MSEFEFEIKPGTLLPPETRMELPEMSYEQELLSTPVPFENRVEFLSDYVKHAHKKMTAHEISKHLGITVERVINMCNILDVPFEDTENQTVRFVPLASEVIEEEIEWERSFELLDEYLSAQTIADYLGMGEKWVKQTAYGLSVYPMPMKLPSTKRHGLGYPKSTVVMLRTIMLHTPPANDCYTVDEVEILVKKDRSWIFRIMNLENMQLTSRMSAIQNRVLDHIRRDDVEVLIEYAQSLPEAAGSWMTNEKMALALGRSVHWVEVRTAVFVGTSRILLNDSNKEARHYSPQIFEELKRQDAALRALEYASRRVSAKVLAVKIGRSEKWVHNRRELIACVGEAQLSPGGREYVYYLEDEAVAILEASSSRQSKK